MAHAGLPRSGSDHETRILRCPSTKLDETYAFISLSCTAEAQSLIALHEGSAPVMDEARLGLKPGSLAGIKPDDRSVGINYQARFDMLDYMTKGFNKMITA